MRKKSIIAFWEFFGFLWSFHKFLCKVVRTCTVSVNRNFWGKINFSGGFFHSQRRAKNLFEELCPTFLTGLYKLYSGRRGERFDGKSVSELVIFAQPFSDFEQNFLNFFRKISGTLGRTALRCLWRDFNENSLSESIALFCRCRTLT